MRSLALVSVLVGSFLVSGCSKKFTCENMAEKNKKCKKEFVEAQKAQMKKRMEESLAKITDENVKKKMKESMDKRLAKIEERFDKQMSGEKFAKECKEMMKTDNADLKKAMDNMKKCFAKSGCKEYVDCINDATKKI